MTADSRDDDAINALPVGTRFGELEITGTLGVGGFGIVYLARDHSLEREIAIKEYMPSQFALRDGQSHVSVRSVSMKETFELGRRSFVNEAKLLARFDHPSLLKVYRFWEANGTAYMAMPRLVGQNLREARKARPTPPPEAWVRRIFDSVLGGLETLHAQHVWHRDVAPDNIFMPADGSPPILLDFGAARQAISDRTQVFTAILKPSFAPIEQYAEATTLRQGPWTDFYALAAAMHELLTGRPPPPATARAMGDELAPLDLEFADTIQGTPSQLEEDDATVVVPLRKQPPAPPPPPVAKPPKQARATPAPVATPAKPRSWQGPAIAGGGVLALVLLGLFVMQLRGKTAPPEVTPASELAASAAAAPAEAPASVPAPAPVQPAPAPVSEAASQAVVPPPIVKPVPTPATSAPAPRPASAPARREAAPKPVPTEKAGEFKPVPRSPVLAAPEPATPAATTAAAARSAAASAAAPAEPPPPKTASEACGGRVLFARAWCIDRQCEKPIYQNDPECVRLREIRNSRANH